MFNDPLARVVCAVGFLLALSPLHGCGDAKPGSTGQFAISYPADWEDAKSMISGMVRSAALAPVDSPDDDFRENVNVVVEPLPAAMTAQQYHTEAAKAMPRMLTDYTLIESKPIKLGAADAVRSVYEHRMGNYRLKVLSYMVVGGRNGFVVTCSAETDAYGRYEKPFEDICATFKLK